MPYEVIPMAPRKRIALIAHRRFLRSRKRLIPFLD